jgi:hypothetical protein
MILVVSAVPLGCGGDTQTAEFNFSDFTDVNISPAFKAEITQGDSYSVSVTTDNDKMEYIEVGQVGDTLNIGIESHTQPLNFHTLDVDITMPDIYGVTLSGASKGNIRGFTFSHEFTLNLSGASRLGGDLTAGGVHFILSGASTVELQGSANDMLANVSGASNMRLSNFELDNANILLSGASSGTVKLYGILDASVSGASKLTYKGSPTLGNINTSGGSTVKKG